MVSAQPVGDWVGSGRLHHTLVSHRPFAEARESVRSLGLRSWPEWREFCAGRLPRLGTIPADIPQSPWRTYRDEWRGMADWLGYEFRRIKRSQFRSFKEARAFARSLSLGGAKDWRHYCSGALASRVGAVTIPCDQLRNASRSA